MINNIDINEIAVSNKFLLVNKISNIFLVTKIIKKLNLYAYFFQKWIYIKDILIRLDVCILWRNVKKILINIWNSGKSYHYVNLLHLFKILLFNFCFLSNDLVSAATLLYFFTTTHIHFDLPFENLGKSYQYNKSS